MNLSNASNFKTHRTKKQPRGRPWRKGQSPNPGGKAKVDTAGLTLDKLIQTHVSPRKLLAALKSAAFKDHDRFALELLTTHLAGKPPVSPPAPEPVPQAADLNLLSVDQLRQLEALMAAAAGDPEPWRKYERERRENLRRMHPDLNEEAIN